MGPSIQDFMTDTMTQELKPGFAEEIWGINMTVNCFRANLCFWMDDLESQAKLVPHMLMPTTCLKQMFHPDRMGPLVGQGGDKLSALITLVGEAPEYVPAERYELIIEEFKTLLNHDLAGVAYQTIRSMMMLVDQDKKGAKPDESRSLKGLIEVLDSTGIPVITAHRKPDFVKNSFDYPIDEISDLAMKFFGKVYLSNGVAMAIAYAMWKGVKRMKIYGCDFTYPNRNFAETGRACVESWICYANSVGMNIDLAPHTSLMDNAGDIGIYGYAEQPTVYLNDGRLLKYQKADASQPFYRPEIVGRHLGVSNELSKADEKPGFSGSLPVWNGYGADGHAPDDGGVKPEEFHSVDIQEAAAPRLGESL